MIKYNPQQALLWRDDRYMIDAMASKKVGWLVLKKLHQQAKVYI